MEKLTDKGKPRCQEKVTRYFGTWPESGQCSRAAVVGDYCRQHDPVAVARRDKERKDKWDREWRHTRKRISGPHFFDVLTKIAEGHNDPRSLAQKAIEDFTKSEK